MQSTWKLSIVAILSLFVLTIVEINALPAYATYFPNSLNVPCPTDSVGCNGTTCIGVGHGNTTTSYCGVVSGAFSSSTYQQLDYWGSTFASAQGANFDWSVACKEDYDQDGQYNGLELGDPCCVWSSGGNPRFTTLISHPGNPTATTTRPPCYGTNVTAPGAPQNVRVSTYPPLTASTGLLLWDPPTEGCFCGYEFEFDGEELTNLTNNLLDITGVFDIQGYVDPLTNYTFRVRAVNLALDLPGAWSNYLYFGTKQAGIPGIMDPPEQTATAPGSLTLDWEEPSYNGGTNITNYIINFDNQIADYGANTTWTWTGLGRGTYVVSITPKNKFGTGPASIPTAYVVTADASLMAMSIPFLAGIFLWML
eukprot:TRINITY_DN1852_c0_g1_i1.p1 TRINITY_DN1852_c0_g1~~TRINITY_DN1852_c0_g1_i1.p1  ORF type:complete len:366 (-),score=82.02 TRINITY_DN1852_c0_g1_i1:78-1175(-)